MWLLVLAILSPFLLIAGYYGLVVILCYKYDSPKRNIAIGKTLPGPKGWPVFGIALEIASKKPHELIDCMDELLTKYKPISTCRSLGVLRCITVDPDHVEEVLKSQKYIPKGLEYFPILPWLGTGLLTSKGDKWLRRRKMLTPTFHFEILEQYLPIINQNARYTTDSLVEHAHSTINLIPHVSKLTLSIIVETAMGTKLIGKEGEEYIQAVNKACQMVVRRAQDPALYSEFLFYFSWAGYKTRQALRTLHQFTENVIEKRKIEHRNQKQNDLGEISEGRKRKAFLDFLIEFSEQDPESMTNLDIREEVDTFMFEGHDTTAISLSWTLFLLASHPEIQDKVVAEIQHIFDSLECGEIRQEHLRRMEYLEKVIKESLRLYPSVPYISRWIEHDLVLGEHTIPAQSNVGIMTYLLHRNPEIFPDPERFDPERFSKENSANRHPFAYIPFSAGPRNCIGQRFALMEEKIVLTQLLSKFKFEAVSKREDVQCIPHVVLRPLDNTLLVRITPRTVGQRLASENHTQNSGTMPY